MQGADANDDDLSTLMPKSVQGLNASPSTETEVQALQEYLELQVSMCDHLYFKCLCLE